MQTIIQHGMKTDDLLNVLKTNGTAYCTYAGETYILHGVTRESGCGKSFNVLLCCPRTYMQQQVYVLTN